MPDTTLSSADRVLRGIELIRTYQPGADFAAEHDVLYFGDYATRALMTPDEQAQMEAWGWRNEHDSWMHFV